MIDVALDVQRRASRRVETLDRLGVVAGAYVLATAHRAGNVDDPGRLVRLVELLEAVAASEPVVLALHPRTRARLEAAGLGDRLAGAVRVSPPLGYLDFTALLCNARAVLTDSGGVQKEAYLAGVRASRCASRPSGSRRSRPVGTRLSGSTAALRERRSPARRRSRDPRSTGTAVRVSGSSGAASRHHQRAHAIGIAHADHLLAGQRHQRIGAFHLAQRIDQLFHDARLGAARRQMDDGFGVGGGLEDRALLHQFLAQGMGVGQVAVMGDGQPAARQVGEDGLDVGGAAAAGGGIAVVADGETALADCAPAGEPRPKASPTRPGWRSAMKWPSS